MKSVLGFLSALSFGVFIAIVVATGLQSPLVREVLTPPTEVQGFRLDYKSLLLGLGLGLTIATLARLDWSGMPRRLARWLVANERNFVRIGFAMAMIAVIVLY